MKEIGGFFGLEQFSGREYHDGLVAVNSGRNALAYLLRVRNIRKLHIPYFLCDSVERVCQRENCLVEYYHINHDFLPEFNKPLNDDEWLYIVNFYGQINNEKAKDLKKQYEKIIFDNVHAFFQPPIPGIDTIYSCRKFFGVPDGGYLATNVQLLEPLEQDISKERMKHVLGRYEGKASEYYEDFKENDRSFRDLPIRAMSQLTHNILRAIDYEKVRQKRNENYEYLEASLRNNNQLSLIPPDGPYTYPFYCPNGVMVKRVLAKKKIYVATLWPNVLDLKGTLEKDFAENILPLPCDQRYCALDMDYIIKELIACIN